MAERYDRIASSCPANTSETDVYQVEENKAVIISSITVCNITGSARTYDVIITSGGATGNGDYIYKDMAIAANASATAVLGLTLSQNYVIRVKASAADAIAFNVWGTILDQEG